MLVSLKDIEGKIRFKPNVIEFFAMKHKEYFPDLKCFNTFFLNQVLAEEKKLLPIECSNAPIIGRMTSEKDFDKEHLFNLIKSKPILRQYIPDQSDHKSLTREFMLAVIYHRDYDLFETMYNTYKNKKHIITKKIKENTGVKVSNKYSGSLNTFKPCKIEAASKSFFNKKSVKKQESNLEEDRREGTRAKRKINTNQVVDSSVDEERLLYEEYVKLVEENNWMKDNAENVQKIVKGLMRGYNTTIMPVEKINMTEEQLRNDIRRYIISQSSQ